MLLFSLKLDNNLIGNSVLLGRLNCSYVTDGVNRNMLPHAKTAFSCSTKICKLKYLSVTVTNFRYAVLSTKADLLSVRERKLQRDEGT